MKICHVITMPDINSMGSITRDIFYKCKGEHVYVNLYDNNIVFADIYILHCFRNIKHLQAFKNFKKPHEKAKIISIIHSSGDCMPADCSDEVVTISQTWHDRMIEEYGIESTMIRGSIDCKLYKDVKIDYSGKLYGKHSRLEKGKYHSKWNDITSRINGNYDANNSFSINNNEERKIYLSTISVYADAHDEDGSCEETFCMSLLEAMACGLPCIILGKGQPAMCELLGDAGIICDSIEDFEDKLKELLDNEELKRFIGYMAKERAKEFDNKKMINEYNKLFKKVLK